MTKYSSLFPHGNSDERIKQLSSVGMRDHYYIKQGEYYFIHRSPTTAIKLPKIFLGISSRSHKNSAAAMKTITTLNVVIDETRLRFPTTKSKITHDKDCKNLKLPVMMISL
ncbi:MAG: hypothetical protein WCJ39_01575 [bacterium]